MRLIFSVDNWINLSVKLSIDSRRTLDLTELVTYSRLLVQISLMQIKGWLIYDGIGCIGSN